MSLGDVPALPTVDCSTQDQNAAEKCFKVKLKGTLMVQTVLFEKHKTEEIFSKLCTKFGVPEENASIRYPLRGATG